MFNNEKIKRLEEKIDTLESILKKETIIYEVPNGFYGTGLIKNVKSDVKKIGDKLNMLLDHLGIRLVSSAKAKKLGKNEKNYYHLDDFDDTPF